MRKSRSIRSKIKKIDLIKMRKAKLLTMGFAFSFIFIALTFRVFYIKTVSGQDYERWAVQQDLEGKNKEMVLSSNRGSIYDREQKSMAISYGTDDVILDVRRLAKLYHGEKNNKQSKIILNEKTKNQAEDTIDKISKSLNIPKETILSYIEVDKENKPKKDTNYFKIAKNVDKKVTAKLMESGVKCVSTEVNFQRTYVNDSLASQVVGFIRGDAKHGVEKSYDSYLTGKDGQIYNTYDEDMSLINTKIEPQDGYSLVTTIDSEIQRFAQDAAQKSGEEYEAENASVVAMNPKTGEVLAMAQYPSFNNNNPTDIIQITSQKFRTELEAMSEEEQVNNFEKVWSNFNISQSFEPGSIFKPMVVASAIEEGIISPKSSFYCGGVVDINGTKIPCWFTHGHGTQSTTQVMANSCNIGMIEISKKMGNKFFYKYQKDFGFGEKTGIDLPGEMSAASLMYSEEDLKNPVQIATSSMGQGFNCTPIQVLNAFSAVINGGNLMKPHAVEQIIDKDGNIVKENTPTIYRKVVSEETSDYMRKALQATVSPSGTGKKAIIEGYNIGGKTGTAEQGRGDDKKYTVSFIGYFPVENPEYIVLTVIHKPKEYKDGVTSAVPTAREFMLNIIKYKGIQPTGDVSWKDNIDINIGSVELEDMANMSIPDATRYLNQIGFDYEIVGQGNNVKGQMPKAGTPVDVGAKIYLYASGEVDIKNLVLVPNLVGVTSKDAIKILTELGLTPAMFNDKGQLSENGKDIKEESQEETQEETNNSDKQGENKKQQSDETLNNTVYEQMPKEATMVPRGTEIKLKIQAP